MVVRGALWCLLLETAICLPAHSSSHPNPSVDEKLTMALPDLPGKEGEILTVHYPPSGADAIHRHDAHAFVYVLEGSIVMQLKGQSAVTLTAGDVFYEGPNDIHLVGRNASTTKPASFVVVLIKNKGAPALVPVDEG